MSSAYRRYQKKITNNSLKYIACSVLCIFLHGRIVATNDNYPVGSRSSGMADASVVYSDLWSVYHNQAGLARFDKLAIGVYNESWFTDPPIGLKALLFSVPVKNGIFGISLRHHSFTSVKEQKLGLAYARMFGEKFSAGVQLNYHRLTLPVYYGSSGTISVEAGILAEPVEHFFIGAHVFNPTFSRFSRFDSEPVQTVLKIGVGYFFNDKINGCFEIEKYISFKATFKAGVEYNFFRNMFLRFGGSMNPVKMNAGFGFGILGANVDVAFIYHQVFGLIPNASLSYNIR